MIHRHRASEPTSNDWNAHKHEHAVKNSLPHKVLRDKVELFDRRQRLHTSSRSTDGHSGIANGMTSNETFGRRFLLPLKPSHAIPQRPQSTGISNKQYVTATQPHDPQLQPQLQLQPQHHLGKQQSKRSNHSKRSNSSTQNSTNHNQRRQCYRYFNLTTPLRIAFLCAAVWIATIGISNSPKCTASETNGASTRSIDRAISRLYRFQSPYATLKHKPCLFQHSYSSTRHSTPPKQTKFQRSLYNRQNQQSDMDTSQSQRIGQWCERRVQWLGERLTGSTVTTSMSQTFFPLQAFSLPYTEVSAVPNTIFLLADDVTNELLPATVPVVSATTNTRTHGSRESSSSTDTSDWNLPANTTTNTASITKTRMNPFKPRRIFGQKPSTADEAAALARDEQKQVWEALKSLDKDMQLLDRLAERKPQLSLVELTLLLTAVMSSALSPLIVAGRLTEFIAPSAAAFTAAIGIAAEYTGRVAVADGKEVAAASMQCAAEAEGFLANAERAKAITPLCVGVGATAATLALLVPVLLDSLGVGNNLQLVTEIYLLCPLVAVLAAAVAGLAVQETKAFCNQAIGIGNRRFARSGMVSRSWLSSTELIERKSTATGSKWRTFSFSVLPAPLLGALCPGALPTKTIVVAALAAAESAYYLARAEALLARATDAVALKSRSAAISDTYANQGARSAAILPFTSALSGLCAAATAAIVELPFVESLAGSATLSGTILEICVVTTFPAISALFAAAAQVSKARCEVDAEAAMVAASTMALPYNGDENDPVLRPWNGVLELVRLTLSNSIIEPIRQLLRRIDLRRVRRFWNRNGNLSKS